MNFNDFFIRRDVKIQKAYEQKPGNIRLPCPGCFQPMICPVTIPKTGYTCPATNKYIDPETLVKILNIKEQRRQFERGKRR